MGAELREWGGGAVAARGRMGVEDLKTCGGARQKFVANGSPDYFAARWKYSLAVCTMSSSIMTPYWMRGGLPGAMK